MVSSRLSSSFPHQVPSFREPVMRLSVVMASTIIVEGYK